MADRPPDPETAAVALLRLAFLEELRPSRPPPGDGARPPDPYLPQVGLKVGSRLKALANSSLACCLSGFMRREGSPSL